MMLESYSTTGISITQGISRGDCPGGFTRLLCSEKDRIMIQPMQARSNDNPTNEGRSVNDPANQSEIGQ